MNLNHMKKAAVVLLTCISSYAFSQSNQDTFGTGAALSAKKGVTSIDHYLASAQYSNFMCTMTYSLAKSSANRTDMTPDEIAKTDYMQCIKEHSAAIKTNYAKALKAAGKNQSLAKELKEHYILSLDQLQGIAPGASERVIDYERRTESLKRATDKQELRVKAEVQ